ncbi:GNAT family N-acetyltransferase [Pseudonocardia xinjiangensis]|uniref:GNAT family N-acetyltransferase n=1 Tax=Pseudonocardia xinjiangensis TaxID=75289 RepID=UPI003D8D35BE
MEQVEISDELIGQRVALRYRIGHRDGRLLYTDAVGELSASGPGTVLVQTRRGPVHVDRAAVVAVRSVPPAPPRRASLTAIARLEGLCADAWPAVVDRPLGAWRLRAAAGWTGRANAGLAIGDPGMPVPAALEAVRSFAGEQAIRPRVHVPVGSPWDRAVTAEGWVLDVAHQRGAEVAVLVAPLDGTRNPRVELPERPSDAWWALALGGPPTPAQRHVLDPGGRPRTVFAQVPAPDGTVTGTVRATVVEDHLHVSMLEVAPTARRQGLATALLASVAAWGREHGARWAVLQVALHNTGARALYDRVGYVEHHQYRYLVPPA